MSHSTVFVFFIVLVGIYITHVSGSLNCAVGTGTCIDSTYFVLYPFKKCDALERNPVGFNQYNRQCPFVNGGPERQTCCVDCANIEKECKKAPGSVGRVGCCPGELEVLRPYKKEETPCCCCQFCQPNRRCLKRRGPNREKGFCVTRHDPVNNVEFCHHNKTWTVTWRWCEGDRCGCCHHPRR